MKPSWNSKVFGICFAGMFEISPAMVVFLSGLSTRETPNGYRLFRQTSNSFSPIRTIFCPVVSTSSRI